MLLRLSLSLSLALDRGDLLNLGLLLLGQMLLSLAGLWLLRCVSSGCDARLLLRLLLRLC